MTFKEFGLEEKLMDGIDSMGYTNATPVQEQVIPSILAGRDIIASAQTGTGKTAAFLLPLINQLITKHSDGHSINAMVLVPTRELAVQISQTMEGISYFTDISSIAVYGGSDGTSFAAEKKALTQGVDMVICTPGRMIAHLNMGYVKLGGLQYLVMDEADRMLDMGFHQDILKIISFLPKQRQNLLFSATMPSKMRDLARKILHNPVEINIAISKPPARIKQEAFIVYDEQKIGLVKYILKQKEFKSVIVFCSKKQNVKQLAMALKQAHFSIEEIHSDLEQDKREEVLLAFRNKRLQILVATDILSRGIDIEDIDLVVNYDVPNDGEDYVHRIGRTARAETDGTAYTFVTEKEQRKFAEIEKLLGKEVPKAQVPEMFGAVPEYNPGIQSRDNGRRKFGGSGEKRSNAGGGNRNAPRGENRGERKPSHGGNRHTNGGNRNREPHAKSAGPQPPQNPSV